MANVEHSILTGADLHEPKGVAAAVANRVYVSNGAASGTWTTVPATAIDAAGTKVFQAQLMHVRDQAASGTGGGTVLTSSSWTTRPLASALTNEISGSLASNQITLAAGTYWIQAETVACLTSGAVSGSTNVGETILRWRNISDGSTTLTGMSNEIQFNEASSFSQATYAVTSTLRGRFTIAGSKTFELQQYYKTTGGSGSANTGNPVSSGESECFCDIMIWKTA